MSHVEGFVVCLYQPFLQRVLRNGLLSDVLDNLLESQDGLKTLLLPVQIVCCLSDVLHVSRVFAVVLVVVVGVTHPHG